MHNTVGMEKQQENAGWKTWEWKTREETAGGRKCRRM